MAKRIFAALILLAVTVGITVGLGLQYSATHRALQQTRESYTAAQQTSAELQAKYEAAWDSVQQVQPEQQEGLDVYMRWKSWHKELGELLGSP